jgi:glycosyltransferase involved in cell wall biosynthesis
VRILLVGDYPRDPRLGSPKVLLKLQQELQALGHTCDILLSDDLGTSPRNRYVRQALGPVVAFASVRRAFQARGAYDVVDVASAEGLWIALARKCGWFRGAAVIARSNGLEHLNYQRMLDDHEEGLLKKPWTRRLFHPLLRLTQVAASARAADRLVLLNEADRDFALKHGWKTQAEIDVIPHGVSGEFLTDAPARDEKRGAGLLFCGSWTDVKGASHLAKAFSQLVDEGFMAPLTILGGAVPRETILSAFSPAARARVSVAERVAEREVMSAYRRHDALVWPSTYEGFGMVVIEAMSQRLPVIATPVGCATFLVNDGKTGLTVQPRRPDLLAAAIKRMMSDCNLRLRLADAAFDCVKHMTWRRTADETLATYARAIATHGRAA